MLEEEKIEPKIFLDEDDNPEIKVVEEEKKEESPEVDLDEEETKDEEREKESPEVVSNEEEIKEEKENPLKEAIKLLANATKEDIDALDEESKTLLENLSHKEDLMEIDNKLEFIKNAIDAFQKTIVRSLDDNEEFRTLSKNTLQKNVGLLEEQLKFTQFNKLLRPLSALYSNYEFMLDAPIDEKKTRSNIEGILEEIEYLLEEYGAEKLTAKIGDDFNPLLFKIAKKVETNDINLDKKVAAVKCCGWKKDRIVFVPLRADMYVYTETSNEETEIKE